MQLKQNDKAPDFDLSNQDGKQVSLSNFRGGKVLLYFYPKAGTSG
jgi:thioredoxin-dependent peroxiredoxin